MGMHAVREQRRYLGYLEDGGRPTRQTLRRLVATLRPHRGRLGAALGLTAVGVLISLLPPLIIREIIDVAITRHDLRLLFYLAAALIAFPIAGACASVAQNYLDTVVSQGVIDDLRTAMYEHGQRLGIGFFTRTPAGEIHSRLVNDLNAVQNVLSRTLAGLFVNTLTILLTLGTMFVLNWQLAVICVLVLPTFALPVVSFGRRSYDAMTNTQEQLAKMTAQIEETLTLSGMIVVKSFGTRRREAAKFRRQSADVRAARVRQSMVGQWLTLVVRALSAMGPAVLYGYGGYLVVSGGAQLGTVVAFATYLAQLYSPASSLAGSNTTLIGGLALFDRIFGFLDLPVDLPEPPPGSRRRPPDDGPIGLRFDQVRFAYNRGEPVLHGISFEARPGELTAVVGPSGAGKSTVLSLGSRFYDPTGGAVRLAGIPLTQIAEEDLRGALSVVTQELYLFHATLEENIRYGRPDASQDEVGEAVGAAQLLELAQTLPSGLQTVVGERGYRLSGGEKQRVAIARAILRNPRVLLLDEATSSLDSHAERLIQQALARLFRGRTVIAVAHRLSTILKADQILVLDRGRIVEQGRHTDLLQRQGLYARLYHEQFDPGGVAAAAE